jgi:lycopene cyclase domain-containing protein
LFGWFLLEQKHQDEIRYRFYSKGKLAFVIGLLIIWIGAFLTFINNIEPLTYLNLILLWAIPPVMVQLIYGSDILWLDRRKVLIGIVLTTFYLAVADALAIFDGIWTIRTTTSTGVLLGGILPIEEFLFFLTTNILVIFGLTLIIDSRSRKRFDKLYSKLRGVVYRT